VPLRQHLQRLPEVGGLAPRPRRQRAGLSATARDSARAGPGRSRRASRSRCTRGTRRTGCEREHPRRDLRKEIPHSAHASFSEKVFVAEGVVGAGPLRPARIEGGLLEVLGAPSPVNRLDRHRYRRRAAARSRRESARREPRFSRTISRSTRPPRSCACALVQLDVLADLADRAVDADPRVPLALQVEKSFLYSPLRPRTTGASTRAACRRVGEDPVDHLLHGLRGDHTAAARAVGHAHDGEEHAK